MYRSTALIPSGYRSAPATAGRCRNRDDAALTALFRLEPLERRCLMSVSAATITLDTSFGVGGYALATLPPGVAHVGDTIFNGAFASTPDGKIYAATSHPWGGVGGGPIGIARFNADGTLDVTFGDHGLATPQWKTSAFATLSARVDGVNYLDQLLVQPDGKLVVMFDHSDDLVTPQEGVTTTQQGLARLNPDGSLDSSFGVGGLCLFPGTFTNEETWDRRSVAQGPDGHFVAVYVNDLRIVTLRLNPDGTPDTAFGPQGQRFSQRLGFPPGAIGTAPKFVGGSVVAGGESRVFLSFPTGAGNALVQYVIEPGGMVTSSRSLTTNQLTNGADYTVTPLQNGGAVVSYEGWIAEFGPDGTVNSSFGVNGSIAFPISRDWGVTPIVQSNGKLLLIEPANSSGAGIQRLNADGSHDTSFAGGEVGIGLDALSDPAGAVLLSDGSIIVPMANAGDLIRLAKILPAGGTPDTATLAPEDESIYVGTGGPVQSPAHAPAPDTTAIPRLLAPAAAFSLADRGLFAAVDGASVFNPGGTRKPFDDGANF